MPRRIAYICDWLPPDFGAIGQYALLNAREQAAAGHNVLLGGLSSTHDSTEYEDPGDGTLKIRRIQIETYDKASLARRLLWTIKANTRLIRRLWRELRQTDEIHFTGSPPFILHFVWMANFFLRKRLVYRIADFHPECLMAGMDRVPLSLRLFHRLTVALRRRVDQLEALGEDQRRRLVEMGIPADRITISRDASPVSIPEGTEPLQRPAELNGYFVLLYSGNWGVAHDYMTFVDGYQRHHEQGSGRIALWLNVTGQYADTVEQEIRARGLPICRRALVPLEDLPNLMVTPDCHLITLKHEYSGLVLPSKVYACIESRKPVLFVGPDDSDVHLLCERGLSAGRYGRTPVGSTEGVCTALENLAQSLEQAGAEDSGADRGARARTEFSA